MNALLSVTDKTGLVELARGLVELGVALHATGGTADLLAREGLAVTEVGALTGVGELFGGRVKTLSPRIFGGILARGGRPEDLADLARLEAPRFDLVVCNLYRFDAAAPAPEEGIDIGGHALIRAAAKNAARVAVLVDPDDYADFLALWRRGDEAALAERRRRLAAKAWRLVARLDAAIAAHYDADESLLVAAVRHKTLRYGENPHQAAAWWRCDGPGLHDAAVVEGKELSYNNLLDLAAAAALVAELGPESAAVIKHQNPCGAAVRGSVAASLAAALDADPDSAYGGVVAANGVLEAEAARSLAKRFIELIVASEITAAAREILAGKKHLRLVEWTPRLSAARELRTIPGGLLTQTPDLTLAAEFRIVSRRRPDAREERDLRLAFAAAKHVRSNAIVLLKDGVTVGIGAGQMNRADAVRLAMLKAGPRARGAVMASDGFLPFADGLAAAEGVVAVIQPGGSIRDPEVIAEADRRGLALVFAGARHFKH